MLVFYISDRTGITAELVGQTLLSQFNIEAVETQTLPYIDSIDKARKAVELINNKAKNSHTDPVLISTIVQSEIKDIFHQSRALMLDVFEHFITPLEQHFQRQSTQRVGQRHSYENKEAYDRRIQAVNFALKTDDGLATDQYAQAEIILLGVSRSGKTPTALYLAMQFGILAANYPITEEDLDQQELPAWASQYHNKLFGLEINANRLHEIRTQRRANSRYASFAQCEQEVIHIRRVYRRYSIPSIDSTSRSIEEIATKIIVKSGLNRYHYG